MTRFETRPLHPRYGLVVANADLAAAARDEAAMSALRALWQEHAVLVFRRQFLDEDDLVAFTAQLGACEIVSRADIMSPYRKEIIYFSTLRYADGRTLGGFAGGEDVDWHSDQTFRPDPATGALLYGLEVPREGGAMYWANQYLAFEALPADVQQAIDGRTGLYSYGKRLTQFNPAELKDKLEELRRTTPDVNHPVVLTHPRTGRKALYADPSTLIAIEGLSDADNARILPMLFAAGGDPSVACAHKVVSGDVMLWDNGCLLHRRDEISLAQPRLMKRTTFRPPADAHCIPHPRGLTQ